MIARNPLQKDPHFGAGYDLECEHCGRLYSTEDDLSINTKCPDEDCPTHWELIGKEFPA